MAIQISSKIKLRSDTKSNFTNSNITLLQGEPSFETDTGNMKIGDGVTQYKNLKYFISEMSGSNSSTVGKKGLVPAPPKNSQSIPLYLGSDGNWDTIPVKSLSDLGITATATEINYIDGCTSNIQQQLNNKLGKTATANASLQLLNQYDNSTYYKVWIASQSNFPSSPSNNVIYFIK